MLRYVTYTMNLTEQGCVVTRINRSDTSKPSSPNVQYLALFPNRSHAMAGQRCT